MTDLQIVLILVVMAIAVIAIAWIWYLKIGKLTPQQALRRSLDLGMVFVNNYTLPALAKLKDPKATPSEILDAGHIAYALVVSAQQQYPGIPEQAAKAHPELTKVDVAKFSEKLAQRARSDANHNS
jgi:predicted permease